MSGLSKPSSSKESAPLLGDEEIDVTDIKELIDGWIVSATVVGVFVTTFDKKKGFKLEFAHPSTASTPDLFKSVEYATLIDGIHEVEHDTITSRFGNYIFAASFHRLFNKQDSRSSPMRCVGIVLESLTRDAQLPLLPDMRSTLLQITPEVAEELNKAELGPPETREARVMEQLERLKGLMPKYRMPHPHTPLELTDHLPRMARRMSVRMFAALRKGMLAGLRMGLLLRPPVGDSLAAVWLLGALATSRAGRPTVLGHQAIHQLASESNHHSWPAGPLLGATVSWALAHRVFDVTMRYDAGGLGELKLTDRAQSFATLLAPTNGDSRLLAQIQKCATDLDAIQVVLTSTESLLAALERHSWDSTLTPRTLPVSCCLGRGDGQLVELVGKRWIGKDLPPLKRSVCGC